MGRDWRSEKKPLKQISGNSTPENPVKSPEELPEEFNQKLSIKDTDDQQPLDHELYEGKSGKARKLKLKEIKGETQTSTNPLPSIMRIL